MPNQSIDLSYDPDAIKAQRQQRLADTLLQQSQQEIPIQSYNGVQAPISPFSIIAKALQGYGAVRSQRKADDEFQQYRDKDTASAQALIQQLMAKPVNSVGTDTIAPQTSQISAATPQLPGQPAPSAMPPTAQMQTPGITGTGPQTTMQQPGMQDQMMALLGAHGGPQTQMIQNAMLPQIMQRQNLDYQHQLGREDKTWEQQQPMSVAEQQQIAAQGAQSQANAVATNKLPMTAAQQANIQVERGKLAEEHSYHQMLTGAGIGDDDPNVKNWVAAVASGNVPGIQSVPKRYQSAVAGAINNAPAPVFAPIAARRFGMASNSIVGPLMKLPQYELTANGLPYIQRIQAALKTPGSVSDQELLDSFTKLSTSGNAISDAQVHIITGGKSLGDWLSTAAQSLSTGGILSKDQRKQIQEIANATYTKYKQGYDPLYKEATDKLQAAGIPKAFWTIPDLNKLNAVQTGGGGGADPNADAKAWLAANPNDPRAPAIRAKLGLR